MKLVKGLCASLLTATLAIGCSFLDTTKNEANKAQTNNDKGNKSNSSSSGGDKPAQQSGGGDQGGYDPRQNLSVMTPYTNWPKDGAGLKQGYWVSRTSAGTGFTNKEKWAVVAVAGDVCKVETPAGLAAPDYIIAMTVNTKTGEVSWAGAGKKGEKPKDIKVNKTPAGTKSPDPTITDEDCTCKAGSFKAKKYVYTYDGGMKSTSWAGVDGDVKDVALKSITEGGAIKEPVTSELVAVPTMEDFAVSGKTFKVKHTKYADAKAAVSEQWSLAEAWPFVGNTYNGVSSTMVKSTSSGFTITVDGLGDDAKPELNWEGK